MSGTSDVIVIGAGIAGASIAFHLAERGLKVRVLEARHVAAGATGRSSGLVRMHYDLEVDARLAWASYAYFRNWREWVGGDCGFTRTGFLQIVSPAHNDDLRANVAMHRRIGIPTEVVSARQVQELVPSFATEDFELAAFEPESGYADPAATTHSLLEAARAHGANLVQDCRVAQVLVKGGRVAGVNSSRGNFDAPVLVDAAGPWAGQVARLAGVELPLDTWTHDILLVRRPAEVGSHPACIDDVLSMYFRPETGGLTLVGLEDSNRYGEAPDQETDAVARGFTERAADRLCRRIPALERGSAQTVYCGRDGITPDQHAILDQAGPTGFYLACGFSGTGFKLGPAVGACMAELILEGKAHTVDISSLTARRFAEGKPLRSEHPYGKIWK